MTKPSEDVVKAKPLHVFLRQRLEQIPDLSNADLARAIGFPRPNVISMILGGNMKLPLSRLPDVARVLEIDPVWLLRLALNEYEPAIWGVLEQVLGRERLLSAREHALIEMVRTLSGDTDPDLAGDDLLAAAVEEACKHAESTSPAGTCVL